MPATHTGNKSISTVLTFTPRQVLLGSSTMKHNNDDKTTCNGAVGLEPEQKVLLHKSIAHYLKLSGFKKTLKKFCSESQIEKDNLEGSVMDLEEMCLKYLDICKEAKAKINYQKEQVAGEHLKKDGDEKPIADAENAGKKKKRSNKSDNEAVIHQTGTDSKKSEEKEKKKKRSDKGDNEAVVHHQSGIDSKNSEAKDNDNKGKDKKKKKSKLASESPSDDVEDVPGDTEVKLKDDVSADAKTVIGAETEKKSKDKKRKKDKSGYDAAVSEKDSLKASNGELTENKDSKKRKRLASEENDTQLADKMGDEESKCRKVEDLDESKGGKQLAQINADLGSNLNADIENFGENGHVSSGQLQKPSGGQVNGDLEKNGEKSSVPRSQRKQQKGSVEKKEVKPFQRVKLDGVVFADERLQDNSYWSKGGAETGYGAKAEEVLGQVRGRDFRHEKTKKKRGSYRGGQIDLQSHSVKFNYSDDE